MPRVRGVQGGGVCVQEEGCVSRGMSVRGVYTSPL